MIKPSQPTSSRFRARRAPSLVAWSLLLCSALLGVTSRVWAAPPSPADTVRFLAQATFGPTPELVAHVQQVGLEVFLDEQFALPLPAYPDLGLWPRRQPDDCLKECRLLNYTMYLLQIRFFRNALGAPDQLRQRVAFALNQLFVISAEDNDLRLPSRMLPYLQVLDRHAFGNFRELLTDITLNPGMGKYLDMAGNRAEAPNENYARELLQLFTIGLYELNPDGTQKLDAQGKPIPAYIEDTVATLARAFTGWVLAPPPQPDIASYFDPMVPSGPRAHDQGEKQLLNGVTLSAGQNAQTDLQQALDNIFQHPNVAPFVSKNLIQHLVISNPSPSYVGRVAAIFASTKGDMKSVIRAILLDPEARDSTGSDPNNGHLREPVLWVTNLLRAFNTTEATTDFVLGEQFLPQDLRMSENLFDSPSVFNFFPPGYVVPGEKIRGPEFAIYSTSTALARTNFAYEVIYHKMSTNASRPTGTWLDLSSLEPLADDPPRLVETLNVLLLHGSISPQMRSTIEASVTQIPTADRLGRVQNAVYLIVTAPQYLIER